MLNLSEFQSCLQVINELFCFYQSKMHSVLIIGDLNADLKRNKRFDLYLNNFIDNNSMVVVSPSRDVNLFSYEKGDYTAMLDHCLSSNFDLANYSCNLIDNDIHFSDHKPLKVLISWSSNCLNNLNAIPLISTAIKI
jgi:endonuclease/exonuclease/phosphatase family metal-dependent hydrolase